METVNCRGLGLGQISRRSFVQTTVTAGAAGLTLPQILAAQTQADQPMARPDAAVIQIWLMPQDVVATMYRHLGIDPYTAFPDHSGRPVPLLHEGTAIPELL